MKFTITLLCFAQLLFFQTLSAQCNGALFQEQNGIAVIEIESATASGWSRRTGDASTGGGAYYAYTGANAFREPGNTILNYKVKINSPGTYRFIWRNKVGIIASVRPSTEHNDSWLRIPDASNFFAKKGTSNIYPKGSGKTPNPNGDGANGWFKVYSSGTTNWTWTSKVSDNDPHDVYATFNTAGVYTIQVAGRSNGHFVDRMVLYKEGSYTAAQAQTITRGETRCGGGTTPPPTTPPPTTPPPTTPPPSAGLTISSFQYVNADTEQVLGTLNNGAQISLAALNNAELNFVAVTNPGTVGSVRLDLSGTLSLGRTENGTAPYTAFGDKGFSDFYGRNLKAGSYTLTATPYSGNNLSGTKGTASTISFTVVSGGTAPPPTTPPPTTPPPSGGLTVSSFQYVNADTEQVLGTLANGAQISLAAINDAELNFVAITNPGTVGSVRLDLSGTLSLGRTENGAAPYTAFGDKGFSNFYGRNLKVGNYTLTATPYSGSNLSGTKGTSSTINFTVVNSGTPSPTTPPPSGALTVTSFQYVNADTEQILGTLSNGAQINLASINNAELNFIAVTNPTTVGSVRFDISGTLNVGRVENGVAPYSVFGDKGFTNLFGRTLKPGSYTLTATPYSGSNLSGTRGTTVTLSFTVVVGSSASNTPSSARVLAEQSYVYPNPIPQSTFSVKLPEEVIGEVQYSLVNGTGVELEKGKFNVQSEKNIQMDIQALNRTNTGVYYLVLKSTSGAFTVPVVKQ